MGVWKRERILRTAVIAIATLAASALAEPATRPAQLPVPQPPTKDNYERLIVSLGERDPRVRRDARERLMLMSRADLPAFQASLEAVLASQAGLNATARPAVRDIVSHVYLTGKHDFKTDEPGRMGFAPVRENNIPMPVVRRCVPGSDAYRMLKPGDVIVAFGMNAGGDAMETVSTYDDLDKALNRCRSGDWVPVRISRDGTEQEFQIRLSPPNTGDDIDIAADGKFAEADAYWKRTFAPMWEKTENLPENQPPTTTPADRL